MSIRFVYTPRFVGVALNAAKQTLAMVKHAATRRLTVALSATRDQIALTERAASVNGGSPVAPVPDGSSTILFDNRSGGAQDIQTATTYAQILAKYSASSFTDATGFLETNVDGAGTKARGIQWTASGGEGAAYVGTESGALGGAGSGPASGWYTSFKTHLGKSATGGGTGTVGQWVYTGSNAHHKMFLWMRTPDNATDRIYLVVRPQAAGGTQFSIDNLGYNSPSWSQGLYERTGEVIKVTCYFSPATGVIKSWINDTLVLDATGQTFGSGGLADIQETATMRLLTTQMVQYIWDTVTWY
jgi:hypothetical protein